MSDELDNTRSQFWDSLTQGLKERMSSTIFFNYIWFWIIYNWEFVYFSIFPESLGHLNNDLFIAQLRGIASFEWKTPLYYAFLLALIIPFLNSIFKTIRFAAYNFSFFLKVKIAGISTLPSDEYVRLLTENNQIRKQYEESISEYKRKIALAPEYEEMLIKYQPFYNGNLKSISARGHMETLEETILNHIYNDPSGSIQKRLDEHRGNLENLLITESKVVLGNLNLEIVAWYYDSVQDVRLIFAFSSKYSYIRPMTLIVRTLDPKKIFVEFYGAPYKNMEGPNKLINCYFGRIDL